jgi:hypothetical protein
MLTGVAPLTRGMTWSQDRAGGKPDGVENTDGNLASNAAMSGGRGGSLLDDLGQSVASS